jgi:hypothetical protein
LPLDARIQGADVERVAKIGRQCANGGLFAHLAQLREGRIEGRRGRCRAILGVERRQQDALESTIDHAQQRIADRWLPVTHRQADADRVTKPFAEPGCLPPGNGH